MSPRFWRRLPSRAGSASRGWCAITSATNSITHSRTLANSRSKTSRDQCAYTGFGTAQYPSSIPCGRHPSPCCYPTNGGFTPRYDYARATLDDVPYDRWREYDPEDTMRFYALRLREAGSIKSSPQKIIADGTDWRFLN